MAFLMTVLILAALSAGAYLLLREFRIYWRVVRVLGWGDSWRLLRSLGATGGLIGNGTRIGYSISSPVTYTRIAQVKNITKFISLVANVVDFTVMGASNIMQGGPGMIPIPTFDFVLLWDPDETTSATHETLRQYSSGSGLSTAGTTIWFAIEVPTTRGQTKWRKFEFQGYVGGITPVIAIGAAQDLNLSVVFSGSYAVYPASASATIN